MAISLVSWFVVAGFVLVVSAAIGAVVAERLGLELPPESDAPAASPP